MSTTADSSVTESSGNVFTDLDMAEPEDALVKAELAHAISRIVTRKRLSQTQAATQLGIDQPKVSALMRGRLAGFSIERLIRLLQALSQDVEIIIKQAKRTQRQGNVRVVTAPSNIPAAARERPGRMKSSRADQESGRVLLKEHTVKEMSIR